jgi:hypothetical protein
MNVFWTGQVGLIQDDIARFAPLRLRDRIGRTGAAFPSLSLAAPVLF